MDSAQAPAPIADARPVPQGMGRFIGVAALADSDSVDSMIDRRMDPGSLRFDGVPIMLTWAPTSQGHEEGFVVGAVTDAKWLGADFAIAGVFDSSESAQELRRQSLEGLPWGLSVEPSEETLLIELRPDGGSTQTLVDGLLTGVLVTKRAALHGAWLKALPDEVVVPPEPMPMEPMAPEAEPMVAGAYPAFPPAYCYERPDLQGLTPNTVEGPRVYGHLAGNGCHRGFPNTCIKIGDLSRDYSHYARRQIPLDDGSLSPPTGPIILTGGHADLRLGFAAAQGIYDDTASAVADVAIWWDEPNQSIAYSGALRPDVTDEQIRVLLASDVSVDYRYLEGERKLAAAICVNTPGYPIPPRITALVASGELMTLIMPPITAADDNPGATLTGGMIALRPASPEDLVVAGGDPAEFLHMTLAFVADDASQMAPEEMALCQAAGQKAAAVYGPITATVAGYGILGPQGALVLLLNGEDLEDVRDAVWSVLYPDDPEESEDPLAPDVDQASPWPDQHEPFIAHVTLGYGLDPALAAPFVGQTITLDRITVDLGGQQTEYPLAPTAAEAPAEAIAASMWREFETDVLWEDLTAPR